VNQEVKSKSANSQWTVPESRGDRVYLLNDSTSTQARHLLPRVVSSSSASGAAGRALDRR
jgi:hypothetical protein